MLETLDYTIRIESTPTFLYFDLYLYSAYAADYVYETGYTVKRYACERAHFRHLSWFEWNSKGYWEKLKPKSSKLKWGGLQRNDED